MENTSSTYSRLKSDYEIMSRIDEDIYFEIELLCEGVKEDLAQLKYMEVDILINTYMHQCKFLLEHVLDYIRNERKTTLRLMKASQESTRSVYRMVHLNELEMAQGQMKDALDQFRETVSFIYPMNSYPDFLLGLNSKMNFINTVMLDLFEMERTRLKPQKIKSMPNALQFEESNMN